MITLIVDTSTDKSLIAIAQNGEVLLKFFLPSGIQSSRLLMTTIESGFKELNIKASALDAIAVGIGPGSYTGTRVGVAAAKGLAFPKSLPLIGFCSLEGFIVQEEGSFASLIDARVGGTYVLLRHQEAGQIRSLSPPQFVAKENLTAYLESFPHQTGPHISYPNPEYLALLADQKIQKREWSSDLELMYLRTPSYRAQF